jgi:hypothetical protein
LTLLGFAVNRPGARSEPYNQAADATLALLAEDSKVNRATQPNRPFGFAQGDPLIVVRREERIAAVAKALQVRGHYCQPGYPLMGLVFGRALMVGDFTGPNALETERWVSEQVRTSLLPDGQVHFIG